MALPFDSEAANIGVAMLRTNPGRLAAVAVVALAGGLLLLLATPRGLPSPLPAGSPGAPATAPGPTPSATSLPTPVPTPAATPSRDLTVELPFRWATMTLPALPAPRTYGERHDANSYGGGWFEVRRDGKLVGGVEMWVYQPVNWGAPDAGLELLRANVKSDAEAYAADNVEVPAIREIPFATGAAVRFGLRAGGAGGAGGAPTNTLVEIWHYDGRAVWRVFTSWPPDPELGNPSFLKVSDFDAFMPVLEELVAHISLPAVLPTPAPPDA